MTVAVMSVDVAPVKFIVAIAINFVILSLFLRTFVAIEMKCYFCRYNDHYRGPEHIFSKNLSVNIIEITHNIFYNT